MLGEDIVHKSMFVQCGAVVNVVSVLEHWSNRTDKLNLPLKH